MVELNESGPFDYVRYVFSFLLLVFSATVTFYAIFDGDTGFWKTVPGPAAFVLFLVCLILLGIVEGLQISLVELKRQHPDSYKNSHRRSYKLAQIANSKDNVERFLMGRQVLVVFLVFFIAKLTTVQLADLETDFFFPVPRWLYTSLLETGFLSCVLVVIVGQLMPQIVAAKYPVHFLNLRVMYFFYHVCTFIEATGLTHACWVLSHLLGKLAGMADEVSYFENSSKRTKNGKTQWQQAETKLTNSQLLAKTNPSMEMEESTEVFRALVKTLDAEFDPEKQTLLQGYLNRHPEIFRNFPTVIGNKMYAAPHDLADRYRKLGVSPPAFLLDISDPAHIPPHIVACQLTFHVTQLQHRIEQLSESQNKTAVSVDCEKGVCDETSG